MAHDLVIRNGRIFDGTGGAPRDADLAIDGDAITAIGEVSAEGRNEIDASGHAVTPGFVDINTHLDAQIGWDPQLTPITHHGVTTALIGNCGVTFAPVGENNRRYLAELMEAVEDISADAIMDGLPWDWTSYGEYLDAVERLQPALNVVGLAGHSSIRFEAMGDKSMDEGVQATDDELEHITRLVRESVEQGAVGFSTSRFLGHRDIPSIVGIGEHPRQPVGFDQRSTAKAWDGGIGHRHRAHYPALRLAEQVGQRRLAQMAGVAFVVPGKVMQLVGDCKIHQVVVRRMKFDGINAHTVAVKSLQLRYIPVGLTGFFERVL